MSVSKTAFPSELDELRKLTARIGSDHSLTQASTGNTLSEARRRIMDQTIGLLWMSAATREDIFIRLNLEDVRDCLRWNLDPSEFFAGASLETAMHAVMPHRIVVHVHSVSGIAWAVRPDELPQIHARLAGLRWQWIPYLAFWSASCDGNGPGMGDAVSLIPISLSSPTTGW